MRVDEEFEEELEIDEEFDIEDGFDEEFEAEDEILSLYVISSKEYAETRPERHPTKNSS